MALPISLPLCMHQSTPILLCNLTLTESSPHISPKITRHKYPIQHPTKPHNTTPHHTKDKRHHTSITYVLDFKIVMYNNRNTVVVGNTRKQPWEQLLVVMTGQIFTTRNIKNINIEPL